MNEEQLMMRNLPFWVVGVRHFSFVRFVGRLGLIFGFVGRFRSIFRFVGMLGLVFGFVGRIRSIFRIVGRFGFVGWFSFIFWVSRTKFLLKRNSLSISFLLDCNSLHLTQAKIIKRKRPSLHIILGLPSMSVIKL